MSQTIRNWAWWGPHATQRGREHQILLLPRLGLEESSVSRGGASKQEGLTSLPLHPPPHFRCPKSTNGNGHGLRDTRKMWWSSANPQPSKLNEHQVQTQSYSYSLSCPGPRPSQFCLSLLEPKDEYGGVRWKYQTGQERWSIWKKKWPQQ